MKIVTYSKNVFVPLTTVCSNNCAYCHFKEPLPQADIISLTDLNSILKEAKQAGCKEVLFTCGSQPEEIPGFTEKLRRETGFTEWIDFVVAACQEVLKEGLLPHSNIGVVAPSKLAKLAPYNASMGLMLETTADVKAHANSPTKSFAERRDFIAAAGELKIPFTSGLLLGIGESKQDRIDSLKELKKLSQQYGHIQEVILQPVDPPKNSQLEKPKSDVVLETLDLARHILPESIALQVPPNLVDLGRLLTAPVDDLGGISSLTPDYINPEHQWPKIKELKDKFADIKFKERLAIYPQYLNQEWVQEAVWDCLQSEGWINEYKTRRDTNKS